MYQRLVTGAGSKGILSNRLDDISQKWILMLEKDTVITKNSETSPSVYIEK